MKPVASAPGVDDPDDIGVNKTPTPHLATIIQARIARRGVLGGLFGLSVAAATAAPLRSALANGVSTLTFREIPHGPQKDHAVSEGYGAQVLIRWGDPVLPNAPAFDPLAQTASAQARQFGINNDYQAFLPLPLGADASDHGLLWLNHEYPQSNMMFPGLGGKGTATKVTREQVEVEIQSIGGSLVEVRKSGGDWTVVLGAFNRRITADTPMRIAGPAAGDARMRTTADPAGTQVLGMVGNCGGGTTPWGTILTAEENFDQYFMGELADDTERENHRRLGMRPAGSYGWGRFHDRFDVSKEPREANRFGWIVEIDPHDPTWVPVKRTALGRFKHEAAETTLTPDGRVVVYSGDDARNEYLYRFVSRDRFNPNDRAANRDLLDHGTLSVARFLDDGAVVWEPLVFGQGPLTPANGFSSAADVVIDARKAADLVQATQMDRPEDVETNPVNGNVYVVLTNNIDRKVADKANPRPGNRVGHILELVPPRAGGKPDHGADRFGWDIFLLAGDPGNASHQARYGGPLSPSGWLACPDNITFDKLGRMWIASDQGEAQQIFGIGDGIWACDVDGPGRAVTRMFYRVPTGAEMCGPAFTPDCRTLFVAVQHPAGDDTGSSYDTPSTRWPDFKDGMPPRSAVVAITRLDGGLIGG